MSCNGNMYWCITSCTSDIPLAATIMAKKGLQGTLQPAIHGLLCSPMRIVRSAIGPPFLRGGPEANRHFPSVQPGPRSGSWAASMSDGQTPM